MCSSSALFCCAFAEWSGPSLYAQLLGIIGEQFTEGEDICGVVVSIRNKQDRVALWTSTASNEAVQVSLGKELKAILDIPDRQTIGFLAHVRTASATLCYTCCIYHLKLSSFSE
jgi:hypothetical protein